MIDDDLMEVNPAALRKLLLLTAFGAATVLGKKAGKAYIPTPEQLSEAATAALDDDVVALQQKLGKLALDG